MPSYLVRLDFPPSTNTYYRRAGHVMHISAAGKRFKQAAHQDIIEQLGQWEVLTCRVGIQIELSRGDKRSYDIDNYIKPVLDVLKLAVIEDDKQVDFIIVKRRPPEAPGCCDVIISELEGR